MKTLFPLKINHIRVEVSDTDEILLAKAHDSLPIAIQELAKKAALKVWQALHDTFGEISIDGKSPFFKRKEVISEKEELFLRTFSESHEQEIVSLVYLQIRKKRDRLARKRDLENSDIKRTQPTKPSLRRSSMSLPDDLVQATKTAIETFLQQRRTRPEIRDRLDLKVELLGQEVVVTELRPRFDNPKKIIKLPIAKAKWNKTRKRWTLYWQRADMKWHVYEHSDELTEIHEILQEVDDDPCCCFWG